MRRRVVLKLARRGKDNYRKVVEKRLKGSSKSKEVRRDLKPSLVILRTAGRAPESGDPD